jgi:hypothetical protein
MKTPAMLRHKQVQRGLKRLEPVASRLRKAASRGRSRRPGSHGSGIGDMLPRATGGTFGRLVGGRRR